MNLKNLATNETVQLPDDLLWVDEESWTPASSNVTYSITGALIVQSIARQKGRHITLQGAPDMAWVTRATVEKLRLWASEPVSTNTGKFRLQFTDGREFIVAFRHNDGPIDAEPVLGIPARSDNDYYRVTIKLMEIE